MREKISYKYKDSLRVYWRIDVEPIREIVNGFWRWEMFVYQSQVDFHETGERPMMIFEFESGSIKPSIHECVANLNASMNAHFLRFATWVQSEVEEQIQIDEPTDADITCLPGIEGWFGIRHNDGWWVGTDEGPNTYEEMDAARMAMTILWQREGGGALDYKIERFAGAAKKVGEFTPLKSGEDAIREYEGNQG